MRPGGRPEPVRRYLRQPLRWAAVAAAAVVALLVADAAAARAWNRRLDTGATVDGTVAEQVPGRALRVTYVHPATAQEVTVRARVWRGGPLPAAGSAVELDVAVADPDQVALAGDRRPPGADRWWYLPLVVLPLAAGARRWWGHRRTEALVAGPGPTFAMTGALLPPGRGGRRCALGLYPLDTGAGGAPVATVPLVATAGLPVGTPAFPVEVKGVPRPFGRVAARAGDVVLWPAGRASSLLSGSRPSEVVAAAPTGLPPAARGPAAAPSGGDRGAGGGRAVEAAALVAALALLGGTAVLTLGRRADAEELRRRGTPVVAEVSARAAASVEVVVLPAGGGEAAAVERARAPAAVPSSYTVGRRYPAHRRDDLVRFDREPYDVLAPLLTVGAGVAVAGVVVGRRRWAARQGRAVAGRGPYWSADAAAAPDGGIELRVPGTDWPVCRVAVPPWDAPVPPLVAPAVVAGGAAPGEWVAVAVGGRWLPVASRAGPPGRRRGPTVRRASG